MKGRRTNPKFRSDNDQLQEPEKVLSFSSDNYDPMLNPPVDKKEDKKEVTNPVETITHSEPMPEWVVNAINSGERLIVTDNPEDAGKWVPDEEVEQVPLPLQEPEVPPPPPGPVQDAFQTMSMAQQEKMAMINQANAKNILLQNELNYYRELRKQRAIPIPKLPSDSRVYPEGTSISYSPYTSEELEAINNEDISNIEKYPLILEGLYTTGIRSSELTYGDFLFTCDVRQLQAFGDVHFKYPYVCRGCHNPGTFIFTLDRVAFYTLECSLPLNVRFHTFPDEIFQFVPHTIGDVLNLMNTDMYWKKVGSEYLRTKEGSNVINRIAVHACQCISHPWDKAYISFLQASESPKDRVIFDQIERALYHGTKPIKFRCQIPLDKSKQGEMAQMTADLVEGISTGELSVTTPNPEQPDLSAYPPWVRQHYEEALKKGKEFQKKEEGKKLNVCGAENEIDVLAGDIIIPFRWDTGDMEYGILPG